MADLIWKVNGKTQYLPNVEPKEVSSERAKEFLRLMYQGVSYYGYETPGAMTPEEKAYIDQLYQMLPITRTFQCTIYYIATGKSISYAEFAEKFDELLENI